MNETSLPRSNDGTVDSLKHSEGDTNCGIHEICLFEDKAKEAGFTLCRSDTRDCKEQDDNDNLSINSQICQHRVREDDKSRLDIAARQNIIPSSLASSSMTNMILRRNKKSLIDCHYRLVLYNHECRCGIM